MAELKTKPTEASVEAFLTTITDGQRRADCEAIVAMLGRITQADAKMWGDSIIGFGCVPLRYPSGRTLEWMQVGFSPRKDKLTFYLRIGVLERPELTQGLGKFKRGKGCLYIKKLEDIDLARLERLVVASVTDPEEQPHPRRE